MKLTTQGRWIILIVAITAAFAAGWIRHYEWREAQWREQCYYHMLEIHDPMCCCIPMSRNLSPGAPLKERDVVTFIKGGKLPKCPSGAEYHIEWVVGGTPPTCPYHGVLISKTDWDRMEAERFKRQTEREKAQPPPRN